MPLIGSPTPRLSTEPLRPLTRQTSRGYELADFAEAIGEPLLPWQREAAIRGLELNPDGTYRYRIILVIVARRQGKSHLLKMLALWRMYVDNARLVVGAAQDLGTAKEQWQYAVDTAKTCPDLADEVGTVRYANGEQCLSLVNGARYIIRATSRSAGRGLGVDLLMFDELREQSDWNAWAALAPTVMGKRNGQVWAASNAGDDSSAVLNGLRERALADSDEALCLLEWSAPDGCDLDDEAGWTAANPGLPDVFTEGALRTAMATYPPAKFRTEHLCQRVSTLDEAVDLTAWADCGDASMTLTSVRARVVCGVDVSPDSAHVSLVAAATAGAGFLRLEVVAAWSSTAQARAELPGALERIKPAVVAWSPSGPAAALASQLRSGTKSHEITGAKIAEACQQFADLVSARKVQHNADPLLTGQVTQASRLAVGDGWRFSRKGGVGHVDAVYASAFAVQAALTLPALRKPSLTVAAA